MSEQSLTNKAKYGLIWSSLERFGTQGIQFLFGIILARLLTPEDYGIIAMPLVFLALAQCFIDSGFSTALIRKPDLKDEDLSTAFYFNIGVGVFCYIILFFASPLIADFYNTPILEDVLKVTALATLLNPLATVQQTILTRVINFKSQTIISITGAIISGCVGLWMAYSGYGVWSLVVQQVGAALIRVILLWVIVKWRPVTKWSKESFEYLWDFGSKLLGVSLLNTTYDNIYPIVIGKFYSPQDLGNYTRAQSFVDLPSINVTGILQRVIFPVLSTMQDNDERLALNYRKILRLSAFCVFPVMTGLAAVADPLIICLLGDKWVGCILFIQLLCLSKMWYPIHAINLNLLTVKGRSDLFLRLEIIKKIIITVILVATIPFGIKCMVSGMILTSVLSLLVNTHYTGKMINCGFYIQMKDLSMSLVLSIAMFILIRAFFLFVSNCLLQLIFGFVIGAAFYIIMSALLKSKDLSYLLEIIIKK